MRKDQQIDKISKKYVKLTPKEIRYQKYLHRRRLRRLSKDVDKTPQYNRYSGGWIG